MRAKWFLANAKLWIQRRNKNAKYKEKINFLFLGQANVANKSLIKAELQCNVDMQLEDIWQATGKLT